MTQPTPGPDSPTHTRPEEGTPPEPSAEERKVDEERREIERGVYQRRTASDPAPESEEGAGETYSPSTTEVNRGRLQGLGVGQTEIDRQRDPTRAPSTDKYGAKQ